MAQNSFFKSIIAFLCLLLVCTMLLSGFFVIAVIKQITAELPNVLSQPLQLSISSQVFDRNNQLIGDYSGEKRFYVKLEQIPPYLVDAFISTEDKDFYNHSGISFVAIIRAFFVNIRSGSFSQGGSTISQQLARMFFLDQRKTMGRKIKETVLALALEKKFSKKQILELYLNKIYLGNHSFGVEAASRNYFRKNVRQLTFTEAALLAGLPKAPSKYAPHKNLAAARKRLKFVLQRLYEDKKLTFEELQSMLKEKIVIHDKPENSFGNSGYFLTEVKKEIKKKLDISDLEKRGFKIYTTYDLNYHNHIKKILENHLAKFYRDHGSIARDSIQGAAVMMNPQTGAVLSLLGGTNFALNQYNYVTQAKRPLGSAFLPILYTLAIEQGHTLVSPLYEDHLGSNVKPTKLSDNFPTLYEGFMYGKVMESARLATALGLGTVQQFAKKLNLQFSRQDMSIALGYGQESLMHLSQSYSVFANGGYDIEPYLIERIEDKNGYLLYQHHPDRGSRVITPQTAFIIDRMLKDFSNFGLAQGILKPFVETGFYAGEHETLHDGWAMGYTPAFMVGFWLGSEQGKVKLAKNKDDLSKMMSSLWGQCVQSLPDRLDVKTFSLPVPSGISFVPITIATSQEKRFVPFVSGTEPR